VTDTPCYLKGKNTRKSVSIIHDKFFSRRNNIHGNNEEEEKKNIKLTRLNVPLEGESREMTTFSHLL